MAKFWLNQSVKKIMFGAILAVISLQLFWGIVIGYTIAKLFAGKQTGQPGIVKSINFQIGSYKLHLHHWLLGSIILIFTAVNNFYIISSQLFYGALGGYIFQGIVCYNDWTKFLIKQKKNAPSN